MIFSRLLPKKGTMGAFFWNCPRNLINFIDAASRIENTREPWDCYDFERELGNFYLTLDCILEGIFSSQ